ncbi:hypothetical protein M3Y94_01173000 [Aphelenchoides besseyi]|nr:hypothetical protein M3Y94_01173000 [Aphelenchoides besseyi]
MEEGEIASSSESEKDAQTGKVTELDEEAQIDRLQAEFAEELAKQLRQSTSQSDQSTKKLTQNGSVNATVEVPRKDTMTNHEVVSMEIESPEQEVEVDEAEQLRQLLLSQMKPKKNTANLTTKQTRQQPSISPHLPTSSPSPPSQIPPPPRPPLFLTSSDRRTSDYVSESDVTEKVVTRPTISISTTSIDTLNLTETPRSPDEVFDLQAFHDIETSEADTDDDLMDYELNLEKAKSEDQTRKNEIQRLVRRQKSNADEYGKVKKAVERAREELTALEKKLTYYADKGVRLNDQIFKLTERIFATQSKRLTATRSEREKWKRKLAHRSERSKDKLKHIKKIALSRPKHKPKVIPLNRVDTPPLPQTTPIAPVNSRLNNCSDLLAALPTLTKKSGKEATSKIEENSEETGK